jgi:hydrophobic/amphiphilic exporter-1 (mainly G- bacteria), HAE1 family
MTGGWTGLSVRRPIGVAVLSAVVCILGGIAASRLKVDLLPEVDFPRISILTNYPGVGPEEMENLLTRPIERAVSTIEGVTSLEGESAEGLSRVQLQFDWGTDLDSAASDVREALDRLRSELPEDAEQPSVLKFDISATPVATIGLSGGSDPRRLRYLADEVLTRRLERLPGIASVQVNGGRVREIRVELSLPRLVALGVTADQVIEALGSDNRNVSAGDMTESGREVLVRTLGEFTSVEDVGAVLVAGRAESQDAQTSSADGGQPGRAPASGAVEAGAGRPVYVRDVAEVSDAFQEIESEQWVDGVPGVVMRVSKQADANTVEVVERLEQEMALINAEYEGRARVVLIHDTGEYIESAITNVRTTALFGAGLAVLVLLLFLRDLRATAVIAVSIPFSVMATFALMYFSGFSLNLISFGGLALGVGMLVDNAIVILENIYRRRQEGLPPAQAAIEGAREVTGAVVSGTLTTIAVFAPVVFLAGFTGVFFTELAMVVVFALICSLTVSITLIPSLAARLLALPERPPATGLLGRTARRLEGGFAAMESSYGRALRAVLANRWLTIVAACVVLAAAYRVSSAIDVELMPQTDEGVVDLDFELPVGTPVERTRVVVRELERRIRAVVAPEEIANIVSSAGPDNPYRPGGGHEGEVEVTLVPVSERSRGSAEIMGAVRAAIDDMPELDVQLRQRTTNPLQRFMRGRQGERLVVEVRGHDLDTAARLARRVEAVMKSVPGIDDVRIGREEGLEERTVQVDTARAADLGLTRAEIARTIETYVLGRVATRLREGGDEYDVRVMLRESDRARTDQLGSLPVVSSRGVVPLSAVADIGARRGPSSIEREGQERVLSIAGGLGQRALSDVVADLEQALRTVERPTGFSIEIGGEAREQEIAFQGLGVGIALAILLVFAVMAVQFESLRSPLLIMSAVPFGFVGVVATLVATGTTFSLNAFLGCIVLVGIAVNNAIVLVDAANQLRAELGDARAAMLEAGRRRLRPVLMTTSTTVLGVLPIALAVGEGAEIQAPLARVLLGGLLVSTLITLLLVPALYGLSGRRRSAP